MKMKDLSQKDVQVICPESNLAEAARIMKEKGIGALPVCDGDRLTGMLTDRDIVVRALAESKDCLATQVRDAMSSPIVYCFEDQDADEVARIMEAKQIRRIVVLNRNKRLVGIASVDDLSSNQALAGEVLSQMTRSRHRKAA